MATYLNDVSRTFGGYLFTPDLAIKKYIPANVSLKTSLVKFKSGEKSAIELDIPFVSAIMQSASGPKLVIELTRNGGLPFIFGSQPIESQADMVRKVKKFKAGFVISGSDPTPEDTLTDVFELVRRTEHLTIGVTDDGVSSGKLLGAVANRDHRESKDPVDVKVKDLMAPFTKLTVGELGATLKEVNQIIWDHKLNTLSTIDKDQKLQYFVFHKDYDNHRENLKKLSGGDKKLLVGVGINTHDYKEHAPALVGAGVDVLYIDSSDGYSERQYETLHQTKDIYGDKVPAGARNVVDQDDSNCLVDTGADSIKVGIGSGSICITREQKGVGREQATAPIDVAKARGEYFKRRGAYIPICNGGSLIHDHHMALALVTGADFLVTGRYFACFDKSPTKKMKIGSNSVKGYRGEGSNRAKNWQRYDMSRNEPLKLEEDVDDYVPHVGKLRDNLNVTLGEVIVTVCSYGSISIQGLQQHAKIILVSSTNTAKDGAHDVTLKK